MDKDEVQIAARACHDRMKLLHPDPHMDSTVQIACKAHSRGCRVWGIDEDGGIEIASFRSSCRPSFSNMSFSAMERLLRTVDRSALINRLQLERVVME